MNKNRKKELLCQRCGNELPYLKNRDYIYCRYCSYKNSKEELFDAGRIKGNHR